MDQASVVLVGSLLVSAVAVWAAAFLVWPAAARARFIETVSEIRDDADDLLISAQLPDVASVRFFIEKADTMVEESGRISMSLLIAVHLAQDDFGVKPSSQTPSYGGLTAGQRRLMHQLDGRLVDAITSYIVRGSRFAVPILCLHFLNTHMRLSLRRPAPMAPPRKLAVEYNRLTNKRPFQHA